MPTGTLSVAAETFLRLWPDYASWLDESRLKAEMNSTLSAAVRRESPFPFVFVRPFFPPEFYRLLSDAWPPAEAFRSGQNGKKLDLELRESASVEAAAGYASLPRCLRDVWDFMREVVNRRIVEPWLSELFAQEIQERLRLIRNLHAQNQLNLEASGLATGRYGANAGRLMMRAPGYKLIAHVDPLHFLVTVLHYFPFQGDATPGTLLYRAERAIPAEVFVTGGSKYFREHGIAVTEVERMPFVSNSIMAFPNLLDAAHGALGPEEGYRRVYQYHLSLRDDAEPL